MLKKKLICAPSFSRLCYEHTKEDMPYQNACANSHATQSHVQGDTLYQSNPFILHTTSIKKKKHKLAHN